METTLRPDVVKDAHRDRPPTDYEFDDGKLHIHTAPIKLYLGVFAALIFFTVLTVALSYVHLGSLNLVVAILIATVKAGLVVTFFMHLRDDKRFITLMLLGGLFFIGIFFNYTMMDTNRRSNELNDASGNHVFLGETEKQAPGGFVAPEHTDEPHEGATHDSKEKVGPGGKEPMPNDGAAKVPTPSDEAQHPKTPAH